MLRLCRFPPRRVRQLVSGSILVATVFGSVVFPAALIAEFGWESFKSFLLPTYPHMTYFPLFLFWGVGLSLAYAWQFICLDRKRTGLVGKFALFIVPASIILAMLEQQGDRMMVFEFDTAVQQHYCMREAVAFVQGGQVDAGQCPEIAALEPQQNLALDKRGYPYFDTLFGWSNWKDRTGSFSISRWFYIINVLSIMFVMLAAYTTLPFVAMYKGSNRKTYKHLGATLRRKAFWNSMTFTLISVFVLFFWIPLRTTYNYNVKAPMFYEDGMVYLDFSQTEFLVSILILTFAFFLVVEIYDINSEIVGKITFLVPFAAPMYFIFEPEKAAYIFGFSNPIQPVMLFSWPMLLVLLLWYARLRGQRDS